MGVKTKTKEFFMKKVLAATLFCAVSSFATWDLFPAQDAGKGEAKLGFNYYALDKVSAMSLNVGARYSIIEGLEASVLLDGSAGEAGGGYILTCKNDGDDCGDPNYTGLNKPIVGVRYWLPMGLGIAIDAILPFGGENVVGKDDVKFGLNGGVQFSTKINDALAIGSEAILNILNDVDGCSDKCSPGMGLGVAVEADYTVGPATPYLGLDLHTGLTKGDADEAEKMTLGLSVGAVYNISDAIYAQLNFWTRLVQDEDTMGDKKPMTITVAAGFKF